MTRRYQTTFTFKNRDNAERFAGWLRRNINDGDYGCPLFVDLRDVGAAGVCVEYSASNEFARGVATGIDL